MARKNTKKSKNIFDLGFEEGVEEDGFSVVVTGTPVSSFSFNNDVAQPIIPTPTPKVLLETTTNLTDNRIGKPNAYGITPPIDGEKFDIYRTYIFRKSTVRKLNELKAIHPDINAYLSSILDAAINHYHDYITKGDGDQLWSTLI